MKRYVGGFSVFLFFLFIMMPVGMYGQVGGDLYDVDTPIDGGISILVAAGIGYGIKKWRDERKDKEHNSL